MRQATLELGLEHGLASVSVEAIAERAGVSTRTFFNYFETKEDAALLQLFTIDDDELVTFAAGPCRDAWTDLIMLFVTDSDRAVQDGADFRRYLELRQQNPMLAGAARRVRRFRSANLCRRCSPGSRTFPKRPSGLR